MTGAAPKLWPDSTVAILAGGPSLRAQDLGPLWRSLILPAHHVITVNDSWRLLPSYMVATSKANQFIEQSINSCVAYFCDAKWWQQSSAANRRTRDNAYSFHDAIYKLWWFSGSPDFRDHPQVNALQLTGQTGLEPDPTGLRHGSNSGYQAIGLAVHLGAKRIILLGYDMRVPTVGDGIATGGRTHWHDEPRQGGFADVLARTMLPHFRTLVRPLAKAGVEVVNATPGSALTCFPRMTLEDALK